MPLHSANVVDKTGRVQKNNDEPNELSSRFERSHLLGMDPWDPDPDTDQIRFWTAWQGTRNGLLKQPSRMLRRFQRCTPF